jgi:hypothetical protein
LQQRELQILGCHNGHETAGQLLWAWQQVCYALFRHQIFFGGGQTSLHTMCLTHDACFHFACCL